MIEHAGYESGTYGSVPQRFDAGTPNYVGTISLAAALDICLFRATEHRATFTSDRNTGVRTIIRMICGKN